MGRLFVLHSLIFRAPAASAVGCHWDYEPHDVAQSLPIWFQWSWRDDLLHLELLMIRDILELLIRQAKHFVFLLLTADDLPPWIDHICLTRLRWLPLVPSLLGHSRQMFQAALLVLVTVPDAIATVASYQTYQVACCLSLPCPNPLQEPIHFLFNHFSYHLLKPLQSSSFEVHSFHSNQFEQLVAHSTLQFSP